MVNDTYATPSARQIAVTDKDAWAVDFANVLEEGETVTTGAATLKRTNPPTLDVVPGFVGSVAVAGTAINVNWNGSYLRRGESYELSVVATISGGVAKTLVIIVEVTV